MKKESLEKEVKEILAKEVKYIKSIKDYAEFTNLLDELIDNRTKLSLWDILAGGKNPHNDILAKSIKSKNKLRDDLINEYTLKSSILINKILSKNLVLTVTIAKQYSDLDLEENPVIAVEIVNEMITEYILFKKKSKK